MTVKQILTALAQLADGVPVVAPLAKALLTILSGFSDKEFDLLKTALAALPEEADIDAADARIYAKILAEKLQSFPSPAAPVGLPVGNPKPTAK